MTRAPPCLPADHPPVQTGAIGVLLVNLGTPDAPTPRAVRAYLREFLSDPRVVELPRWLWQPILRAVILNLRPRRSAHAYARIWGDEGSPLAAITAAQARALQARLGEGIHVRFAMRYGRPAIAGEIDSLMALGCERILIAPLYPQYSAATTASVMDALAARLGSLRFQPAIRVLPPYYDDPAHIAALARDLGAQLDALPFAPEVLLLSFHGLPERSLRLGDPYHCHCRKTARLLAEALSREGLRIEVAFQSRFGRAKWLEPATDAVLRHEARSGTRRLAVAAPGFAADCLETLEELAIRGREVFLAHGGEHFTVLSCLNAGSAGMEMLELLVRRELSGWL